MSVIVELSPVEQMLAGQAGLMRRVSSVRDGLNKNIHADKSDWATDINGAAAEMAFAKFLNVYWSASNRSFKEPDVGEWHVRSTEHADGHLIVRPNDKKSCSDDASFVLVLTHVPKFEIVGFIPLEKASVPKYWRSDRKGWWVPQSDLLPFGDTQ